MAEYSPADKFLHWLALSSPTRNELAFDLEKALFLNSAPEPAIHNHVFVQGLARAGTTILMREIYRTGEFSSLTYSDMPFVLCCNAWAALTSRSHRVLESTERAHGDGIFTDIDSPEALDEVFWRVFCGDRYLHKDYLQVHSVTAETLDLFKDYIRLILRRAKKGRYLSKNNNNILRLPALLQKFPDACFFIPVRSPLQHAASLLSQHRRFSNSDKFTRNYMTWLGHHEFGATHRPFRFPQSSVPFNGSRDCIDYWLAQWLNCYKYLDRILGPDVHNAWFVPYELLCEEPAMWARITERIEMQVTNTETFRLREHDVAEPVDRDLLTSAQTTYDSICRKVHQQL